MFSFARSSAARFARVVSTNNNTPVHTLARSASTRTKTHGFMQFFNNATYTRVGRPWTVHELRIKSHEDLTKLHFVLLKERNALATYQYYCKQNRVVMKNKERINKVQSSMKAIKVVLGERRHAFKETIVDKDFLRARTKARKERQLVRHADSIKNAAPKTANQIKNVTPQAKKWRRKTMGSTLQPVLKQATVV